MTNDEIVATLDSLMRLTERLIVEVEPLAKATREKYNPEFQHEVVNRVDAIVSDVRSLRQSFDKNRGMSETVPERTGFQREVK